MRARRRALGRRAVAGRSHLPRNLLVDVTGNTHRAEFCIDKLYSPDTADGPARAGRVPRLRDAAARADEPDAAVAAAGAGRRGSGASRTAASLVRWGTPLHDRFMLPHFVVAGFPRRDRRPATAPDTRCEADWFAPHFEFRFPRYGRSAARRHRARTATGHRALARARRGAGAAAARRATSIRRSSGCRCKVARPETRAPRRRVQRPPRSAAPDRAARRIRRRRPVSGLAAAVAACTRRFRCTRRWCSRSSTHGPAARSAVARITWPIPGGRNFETRFPVNSYEAESRRLARFSELGHTPGPVAIPAARTRSRVPADPRPQARLVTRRSSMIACCFGRGSTTDDAASRLS